MSKILLSLFLFSLPLHAADLLEEIVVEGDKKPQIYSFGDTTVLRAEDIKQNTSPFFGEILKNISSFVSVQNGGPGGRQSFFFRGANSRQLAFMVDHLKVNDPSNTDRHFDSSFTFDSDIDEVIVFKNPQPVLYGSDAIGGVILLKTRKGPRQGEKPYSLLSFGAGSFSSFQQTFQNNWKSKNNQGTLTLNNYKTMGLSRLNRKRTKSTERDGSEVVNLASSSLHKWSRFESDLLIKYIHGMAELDGYDNQGNNADTDDRSYNDQYLVQQKTRTKYRSGNLQLRQGLNRHHRRLHTKSGGREIFVGNNFVNELMYVYQRDSFDVSSGLAHENENYSDNKINRSFDLSSLFLHAKHNFKRLGLHAGLRGDNHSLYGNFLSGSSGINLNFDHLDFFIQYAEGSKAPSLYQLYAPPFSNTPVGNKNLRPEINKATEIGIKGKTQKTDFAITLFQNEFQSQFTFVNGRGYLNQDHYIAQGVESNLSYFFTEDIRWQNSYTHQQFSTSKLPLRRPQNSFVSSLFWTPVDWFEFFFRERVIDARRDLDEMGKSVMLQSYQVSSAGFIIYKDRFDFKFTVENIFNFEYEDIYASTVMPLSFWSAVTYRF